MKIDNARKLLDGLQALQNSYSSKVVPNDELTQIVVSACDIKLTLKTKDAIKFDSDFKAAMTTLLKPYIDQQFKDLQNEVGK